MFVQYDKRKYRYILLAHEEEILNLFQSSIGIVISNLKGILQEHRSPSWVQPFGSKTFHRLEVEKYAETDRNSFRRWEFKMDRSFILNSILLSSAYARVSDKGTLDKIEKEIKKIKELEARKKLNDQLEWTARESSGKFVFLSHDEMPTWNQVLDGELLELKKVPLKLSSEEEIEKKASEYEID